jgi:hypothetical protein
MPNFKKNAANRNVYPGNPAPLCIHPTHFTRAAHLAEKFLR